MKIVLLKRIVQEAESQKTDAEVCLKNLLNVIKQCEDERDMLLLEVNKTQAVDVAADKSRLNDMSKVVTHNNSFTINDVLSKGDGNDLLKQKEDFEHELWHLRAVIKSQSEELNIALKDKKQLEDDLENDVVKAIHKNSLIT